MADDSSIDIPARFWKTVTDAEFHEVCMTSTLDALLCARLWRMLDRQDIPPDGMHIRLNREQVMKEFPGKV